MAIAQNFPIISPSLSLDFANVQALDPRITFTRATTATYYGTRTALAEQNLVVPSEEFDNTGWGKAKTSVTANSIASPNGTITADTLTADGTLGAKTISATGMGTTSPAAAAVSTTGKTFSVFAKKGTNDFIQLYFGGDATAWADFDLSAGTAGSSGSNQTATITSFGNGWYRCAVATSSTTVTTPTIGIISSSTAARGESNSLATDVYLWGAQLENRTLLTAYTPTTTQPITTYIPVLETAASNVARFDHNPVTFESLGLLIEQQSTNVLLYSEQFENAYWAVKSNVSITVDTIVSPDGTLDADKLVENTASGQHWIGVPTASVITSGVAYTLSLYAKQAERGYVHLQGDTGSGRLGSGATFNLTDGTVFSVPVGSTATIASVGNGWYRCSITATASSTGTAYPYIGLRQNSAPATPSYTGDGWSGLYIWGAQFETGAFASSYIPTVASQVTRAADSASVTGANFTSFYNQAAGSLYVECSYLGSSGLAAEFVQSTSVSNRWYTLGNNGSNRAQFVMRPLGSVQADINDSGVSNPPNTMTKITVAYAVNDFAISQNGRSPITDTSGYVTNDLNQLIIGNTSAGNASLNGRIKKLAYYPLRLTDTQLQALTG